MPNTLDIFSTYTMMATLELVKPETFFFSTRYFPTGAGDIFNSDKVLVEYTKRRSSVIRAHRQLKLSDLQLLRQVLLRR